MVIELREDEEHGQNVESTLFEVLRMCYITDQPMLVIFQTFLHLEIIKSEINFKLKVKMTKTLIIMFSMGIDHSNLYIHMYYCTV